MCLVSNPPCNNDSGLLMPICDESCLAFCRVWAERRCSNLESFGNELVADSNSVFDSGAVSVLIKILLEFNCTPSHYYFFDDVESIIDPTECTNLFSSPDKERLAYEPYTCIEAPLRGTVCEKTALVQNTHYILLPSRNTNYLLGELNDLKQENISIKCSELITFVSCFYIFPPCDPTSGYQIEICSDLCDNISSLIETCVQPLTQRNELVTFLDMFNCSSLKSQFYVCGFLGTSSQCLNTLSYAAPPDVVIIATGSVAGVLLILIAALILVIIVFKISCRRKKKHANQLHYKSTITLRHRGKNVSSSESDNPYMHSTTEHPPSEIEGYCLTIEERHFYEQVFSSIIVPFASITQEKEIGKGAFGTVYLGKLKLIDNGITTTKAIAMKTIDALSSKEEVRAFFEESLLMKDFKHPNILGLTGVCLNTPDGMPYILVLYMENGSLKDYLKRKRVHVTNVDELPECLSLSSLVRMCMDVTNGMEYLSLEKFVHRDLAARNCMVDTQLAVRVGDFGLARDVYSRDYYRANQGARIPVKWMPPETLLDSISNEKTDVWSYGVTCWEVFSLGRSPYPGIENQHILKYITTDCQRLEKPSLCPDDLYNMIMARCFKLLPEERPTFSQLVVQLQEYWEEEHAYVVDSLAITLDL